jgi:hypothetical protein
MVPFRSTALHSLTKGLAHASCAPTRICSIPRVPRAPRNIAPRCFSTTLGLPKKIDFTQRLEETTPKDDDLVKDNQQKAGQKAARKNAGKTSSLRSVAVEAQRSRTFVKLRGRQRFIDPDADTKVHSAKS